MGMVNVVVVVARSFVHMYVRRYSVVEGIMLSLFYDSHVMNAACEKYRTKCVVNIPC